MIIFSETIMVYTFFVRVMLCKYIVESIVRIVIHVRFFSFNLSHGISFNQHAERWCFVFQISSAYLLLVTGWLT